MKIGYIISFAGDGTGINTYTYNLLNSMANISSHEFILLRDKACSSNLTKDFRCIDLPYSDRLGGKLSLGSFFMRSIQRRERFDIIHDPYQINPFLFNPGFSRNVLTIHDVTPLKFADYHVRKNYLLHKYFLALTLKNVDRIIAVSDSTRRDILEFYDVPDSKIEVIPEAAENAYRRIEDPAELAQVSQKYGLPPKFILFVGTLEPRKGIDTLLNAFALVKEQIPEYKLVIIGKKGWKYERIFNLFNELQIADRVIFTGYVPKADLPYLYNLAGLFVYPTHYEGFGLPVLEAMACGCPVITCNTSSIAEIVSGKSAILIKPGDSAMLAKGILSVVEAPELREDLIREGFKTARSFSWEKAARETVSLYEKLERQPETMER